MKKTETKNKKIKSTKTKTTCSTGGTSAILLISAPRITEKATMHAEANVYTFNVSPRATKPEIAKAIISLYKVTPVKIATVTIPAKKVFIRGKHGKRAGGKKALIYLKKGEKIEVA